jgi:hypothetical protein
MTAMLGAVIIDIKELPNDPKSSCSMFLFYFLSINCHSLLFGLLASLASSNFVLPNPLAAFKN